MTKDRYHSWLDIGCLTLTLLFCFSSPHAYSRGFSEYNLKAAFLIHFVDFTKWPSNGSNSRSICIIGESPFENYLNVLSEVGQQNIKILIKHKAMSNDTDDCHILFIARSEKQQLDKLIKQLENKPLLIVSDIQDFASKNGMIELAMKSEKINLVINLNEVKSHGLKLSSNLIELAQVVVGSRKQVFDK